MKNLIAANTTSYHEQLIASLRNRDEATTYLKVALEEYEEDGDTTAFLLALRNVAEAEGGMTTLAEKTRLNRQNLYRIMSGSGNPTFQTLDNILHALGFRLSIEPLASSAL